MDHKKLSKLEEPISAPAVATCLSHFLRELTEIPQKIYLTRKIPNRPVSIATPPRGHYPIFFFFFVFFFFLFFHTYKTKITPLSIKEKFNTRTRSRISGRQEERE
jgi:hypothetical protein